MVLSNFFRKHQQRIFPIVLCLSLPLMSMVTSLGADSQLTFLDLVSRWVFGASYLLLLWYLNAYLFGRVAAPWRGLKIIGFNLVLILVLIILLIFFALTLKRSGLGGGLAN